MKVLIEKLEEITIISIVGKVESAADLAQITHASANCEVGHENIILDLSYSDLKSFDFFVNIQCQQENIQKSLDKILARSREIERLDELTSNSNLERK